MAIKRPDIYEHNNPNLPIVDSDFIKGGIRSAVSTLGDLYTLTGKASQLKQHSTQIYVSGENKFFVLKDVNNIGNSNGWQEVNFGGGGAIENAVYTTGTQTITGPKNFTARPTLSGLNLITTGDLVNLELQILGFENVAYTTGNQTISGTKTFVDNVHLHNDIITNKNVFSIRNTGRGTQFFGGEIVLSGGSALSGGGTPNIGGPIRFIGGSGGQGVSGFFEFRGESILFNENFLIQKNGDITCKSVSSSARSKVNGTGVILSGEAIESNGTITRMIKLTQAEYNALSPKNPTTFYVIVS